MGKNVRYVFKDVNMFDMSKHEAAVYLFSKYSQFEKYGEHREIDAVHAQVCKEVIDIRDGIFNCSVLSYNECCSMLEQICTN